MLFPMLVCSYVSRGYKGAIPANRGMYQTSLKNRVAQCAAWISIGGTEGHVLQGMVTWVQSTVRTLSFELHAAAEKTGIWWGCKAQN